MKHAAGSSHHGPLSHPALSVRVLCRIRRPRPGDCRIRIQIGDFRGFRHFRRRLFGCMPRRQHGHLLFEAELSSGISGCPCRHLPARRDSRLPPATARLTIHEPRTRSYSADRECRTDIKNSSGPRRADDRFALPTPPATGDPGTPAVRPRTARRLTQTRVWQATE